jgi:hypothetical protein
LCLVFGIEKIMDGSYPVLSQKDAEAQVIQAQQKELFSSNGPLNCWSGD